MKEKRESMPDDEWRRKSRLISEALYSLDEFSSSWVLMTYVSFGKEPDTLSMIEKCLGQARSVCIPKTIWKTHTIEPVQIFNLDDIDRSGIIPQPFDGPAVDPATIELIIVPGVVFDRFGNRIGMGGGFYDKFLDTCHAVKIGLAFDFQVLSERIPSEGHDVRLDMIVTDKGVIHCAP